MIKWNSSFQKKRKGSNYLLGGRKLKEHFVVVVVVEMDGVLNVL